MPHPIAKHLYAIAAGSGESFFRLYDDWLALSVAAFLRDDPAYMKIMGHYGPRVTGKQHPADHFKAALHEFLEICARESALGTPFPDVLGTIYEEEALTNHYAGQFFTPEHLCKMMCQMTLKAAAPEERGPEATPTETPEEQPLSICDPACGSGRFFIHAQPLVHRDSRFTGIDRDLTCVHMTTLNLLVRNANAVVVHGNTLSLETWGGYQTTRTIFGGEIRALTAQQASSFLMSAVKAMPPQPERAPAEDLPIFAALPPAAPAETPATPAAPAVSDNPTTPPEPTPQPFVMDRKGQFGFDF
ncbi:MAG: N-6 DNA methylase [Candidatus Competibacter sp.]|nr:N-6 DNA methylase [Candidatus Competibacter sp.]